MTYTSPAGWIEVLGDDPIRPPSTRFHHIKDCPRIQNPESLREVDRPYSAPRCNLCAPDNQSRPASPS
jgi:hypothetical protein